MEKLKAKHDHKLTDILKVAIFGLMLILPGLILLPSMLYYGVNEYATAPTEQVEKIEYKRVNFNQLVEGSTYTNDPLINNTFNNGLFTCNYDLYQYADVDVTKKINVIAGHKYYIKKDILTNTDNADFYFNSLNPWGAITHDNEYIYQVPNDTQIAFHTYNNVAKNGTATFYINVFDLTQMFGAGNEPTITQFNEWYPNIYYEYTESRYEILEIPTGTYETYTDITSQIQYNWNSLWQQPLFSWTNYTILKQGLDNFTYVFGITQTSYINNLITYELIMVAIYIVIDIVLTLFKWLTHLIGEK